MSDLIARLRERARIRRQIPTRKSVQENKPDRIADLLDEAADALDAACGQNKTDVRQRVGDKSQGHTALPGDKVVGRLSEV